MQSIAKQSQAEHSKAYQSKVQRSKAGHSKAKYGKAHINPKYAWMWLFSKRLGIASGCSICSTSSDSINEFEHKQSW